MRAVPVSAILGSVRGGFLAFIGFKWELPVWSALASLLNCPTHNRRLYWALTSNQKEEFRQIVRWQMDVFLSGVCSEKPFKRKVQTFQKRGADEMAAVGNNAGSSGEIATGDRCRWQLTSFEAGRRWQKLTGVICIHSAAASSGILKQSLPQHFRAS